MSSTGGTPDGLVSVGTVKMIGFLLAICGNTLIACSLTLQKSAHNSLNQALTSSSASPGSNKSCEDDLSRHLRDEEERLASSNPTLQCHASPPPPIANANSTISAVTPSNSIPPRLDHSVAVNLSSGNNVIVEKKNSSCLTPDNTPPLDENDPESQLRLPPSAASVEYDMYAHSHVTESSSHPSSTSSSSSTGLGEGADSNGMSSTARTGFEFLRNPTWWIGTFLMAAGEIGNFAAFAYAPASLVAPLGAWSVVLSAILAHVFLHETISNVNLIGISLCVAGAFLIGTSGPDVSAVEAALDAASVSKLLIRIPFVIFIVLTVSATMGLIYISHRTTLGQRYIFVYVGVSSLLGAVTVVCAKALSTFLRLTIEGNSQFGNWLPFVLGTVLACAILAQLRYLNLAMAQFGNAQVIPVYYVLFTTCAMTSGVIMYREFDALTVRNLPFFVGISSTMSGVFLVSRSARPGDERNGSPLPVNNVHGGSGNGYRSSSKRSRTPARYERVLPVSPMSSPRSGQQAVWS